MITTHLRPAHAVVAALIALQLGCGAPQRPMIPAERIAREPVPSGWLDTTAVREGLTIECFVLLNSARDYRGVQLAAMGVTTLGIIGSLIADDDTLLATASQIATAAGTVTQLAAGTGAMVKERQAYEKNCF